MNKKFIAIVVIIIAAAVIIGGWYVLGHNNNDNTEYKVFIAEQDGAEPFVLLDYDGNEIALPVNVMNNTYVEFTLKADDDVSGDISYVQNGKVFHLGNLTDTSTKYSVKITADTAFGYSSQKTLKYVDNATEYLFDGTVLDDMNIEAQTFYLASDIVDSEGKFWAISSYEKAVVDEEYYIDTIAVHPPTVEANVILKTYFAMFSYFNITTAEVPDELVKVDLQDKFAVYGQTLEGEVYSIPGESFGVVPIDSNGGTVYYKIGDGEAVKAVYNESESCYVIPGNSETDAVTYVYIA
jgi:hypothetical protein